MARNWGRRIAMLVAACSLILSGIAAPRRADATTTISYVVSGGGWGHGLGLSQWGAKGYADQGWNATQILQHFYSGTTVSTGTIPSSVRVGIAQNLSTITLRPTGDLSFTVGSTLVATAHNGETWHVTALPSGAYRLDRNGTVIVSSTGSPTANLMASWNSSGGVVVAVDETGYRYRWGPLELNTMAYGSSYRLRAILVIAPFDKYLYGLGEVPSSWPAEALKAQVIAARTYAVEKISRLGQNRSDCNCAVYSTTADQAYVGYDKESGSYGTAWTSAVDSTAGKLVLYQGAPIQAYYASSDGGWTENNENVWGGSPIPYLRGVQDAGDAASPDHSWTVMLSQSQMQAAVDAASDTAVGTLGSIDLPSPYGVSGRILSPIDATHGGVTITGSTGTKRVSGARFGAILGLKSTLFRIRKVTSALPGTVFSTSAGTFSLGDGTRLRSFGGALASRVPSREIVDADPQTVAGFVEGSAPFREGTILRDPAGGLWFVSDGKRRPFANDAQRVSMGYPDGLIVNVAESDLDVLPPGDPMDPNAPEPDGTFFRDENSTLFWILSGKRYLVPGAVLPTWKLWWSLSHGATTSMLSTYPDGGTLGYRDGTLVRGSTPAVYLVSGGTRRHIANAGVFRASGFQWSAVRNVDDSTLAYDASGPDITSVEYPQEGLLVISSDDAANSVWLVHDGVRKYVSRSVYLTIANWSDLVRYPAVKVAGVPAAGVVTYREGSLLGSPSGSVYLVGSGSLHWIRSASEFDAMGLSWSSVRHVPWFDVGLEPGGAALDPNAAYPDGALTATSTGALYQVMDGRRHLVTGGINDAVAASYGFSAGEVLRMNAATAALPEGTPLGFREGELVKGSSSTVYLISDGTRRGFTSAGIFTGLGYSFSNVRTVPDSYLSLDPLGAYI